jgi:hypothetical protein
MKWFDRWFYKKAKQAWENKNEYEKDYVEDRYNTLRGMKMNSSSAMVERGNPEGQDRITFELTSAVGGRILNVRRYDDHKDRHDNQTYVIPSGEDVGSRVAKIINLELIK